MLFARRNLRYQASTSAGSCSIPVLLAYEDSLGALIIHSKLEGIILPKQAMGPLP